MRHQIISSHWVKGNREVLSKLFNIEDFTYVHSSEMEESSARSYRKLCKLVIRK